MRNFMKKFRLVVCFFSVLFMCALNVHLKEAQAVPEFRSNTVLTNNQIEASIDTDDFLVSVLSTWRSQEADGGDIYYRIYGAPRRWAPPQPTAQVAVDAIAGTQRNPKAGMSYLGNYYVIVWVDDTGDGTRPAIFATTYTRIGGQIVGTPSSVKQRINAADIAVTAGGDILPDVSMDQDGNFVVVWTSDTGDNRDVWYRYFNHAVVPLSGPTDIRINQTVAGEQYDPVVSMNKAGSRFVTAWTSDQNVSDTGDIYCRVFPGPIGGGFIASNETLVNTTVNSGKQHEPTIDIQPVTNMFAVAWTDDDGSNHGGNMKDVYAKLYSDTVSVGAPLAQCGGEFVVNNTLTNNQEKPSVSMSTNPQPSHPLANSWVVGWTSFGQDSPGTNGLYKMLFDVTCTPFSTELLINTLVVADNQDSVEVGMDTAVNVISSYQGANHPIQPLYSAGQGYDVYVEVQKGPWFDYGDAPDNTGVLDPILAIGYKTLKANGGPRHANVFSEWLGPALSLEDEAKVTNRDEFDDGVIFELQNAPVFTKQMFRETVQTKLVITIRTMNAAGRYNRADPTKTLYLNGWIDWNVDGVFDKIDPNDRFFHWEGDLAGENAAADEIPNTVGWAKLATVFGANGTITLTYTFTPNIGDLPATEHTWSRFRLSYGTNDGAQNGRPDDPGPSPQDQADFGEVEDIKVRFGKLDFGDAPQLTPCPDCDPGPFGYPSQFAFEGARHEEFYYEWLGDDVNGEDDSKQCDVDEFDDGVVVTGTIGPDLVNIKITITVRDDAIHNMDGSPTGRYNNLDDAKQLYLYAWLDWDLNGWDAPETKVVTSPDRIFYWKGDPINGTSGVSAGDKIIYDSANDIINEKGKLGVWQRTFTLSINPRDDMPKDACTYLRVRLFYGDPDLTNPLNTDFIKYEAPYGEVEDHVVTLASVVTLSSFTISPSTDENGAEVKWTTASEIDNEGFNIWRSTTKDGEYTLVNNELIPGEGGVTTPHSYTFTDSTAQAGVTYYYKLEDVDADGTKTMHGPLQQVKAASVDAATPSLSEWGVIVLMLSLIGAAVVYRKRLGGLASMLTSL